MHIQSDTIAIFRFEGDNIEGSELIEETDYERPGIENEELLFLEVYDEDEDSVPHFHISSGYINSEERSIIYTIALFEPGYVMYDGIVNVMSYYQTEELEEFLKQPNFYIASATYNDISNWNCLVLAWHERNPGKTLPKKLEQPIYTGLNECKFGIHTETNDIVVFKFDNDGNIKEEIKYEYPEYITGRLENEELLFIRVFEEEKNDIPHFHIASATYNDRGSGKILCTISLLKPEYLSFNGVINTLTDKQASSLNEILKQESNIMLHRCNIKNVSNWEHLIDCWSASNYESKFSPRKNRYPIQPDYSKLNAPKTQKKSLFDNIKKIFRK